MLIGNVSDEEVKKICDYTMNPVDSRIADAQKPDTLVSVFDEPEDVKIFDGFKDMEEAELSNGFYRRNRRRNIKLQR